MTSKHPRSTPATTPSTRTSTTATRTTTTSPGLAGGLASSADSSPAPFTFEALVQAYLDCRANKRNTASALQFEQALEANLWALYGALTSGTYRIGRSICFVVTRPQPREVWAAEFTDRVVHHLVYNHIAPRFHASFAAASSACIPGRGTLYAANRLAHHARSVTRNGARQAFYLQFDLANFFVSIDKTVLAGQLARKVTEPFWLSLALQVLHHDPRDLVDVRSPARLLAKVPHHKSLFNAPAHCGLPIGNLSSQFFANVYLDALDQHIKHQLRIQHYVRYVDDGVLLHESAQVLSQALARIAAFLPEQLHCKLHPGKCFIQPVARGIDFVGHQVTPWAHTTRRKTLRTALHRLEDMDAADVFAAGNSYLGLMRQAHHSHTDQARVARALMKRGHTVAGDLTKIFRKATA
ncbi:MAG: RNA-directed DNA polymerase [Ramlibacter sp.]|nr:RNA-directed DNA polymerase [Ramlibacter sp.]